jgi:hypothetical protein
LNHVHRRLLLPTLALATSLVAGCADPAPLPEVLPPAVELRARHYLGSAISGPLPAAALRDDSPDAALQVRVRWAALSALPCDTLAPVATQRRLLLDLGGVDALNAIPDLSAGARAGVVDAPARWLEERGGRPLGEQRAALPEGVTAQLGPAGVAVRIHRRRDALDVAVLLERSGPGAASRRELVVLDPFDGADRLALAVLVATPGSSSAIAVTVEVEPPPAIGAPGRVAHRAAHAACVADLARDAAAARAAAARDPQVGPRATDDVGLVRALEALRVPEHRRGALFALGGGTGAPATEDAALGADQPLVDALAACVLEAATAPGAPRGGPALGWLVERATLAALAAAAEAEPPSPVAAALLTRAAGVVGAYPGSLRDLAGRATDLDAWRAALVAANTAAREDPAPLQRILAAEWLAARGEASETDALEQVSR